MDCCASFCWNVRYRPLHLSLRPDCDSSSDDGRGAVGAVHGLRWPCSALAGAAARLSSRLPSSEYAGRRGSCEDRADRCTHQSGASLPLTWWRRHRRGDNACSPRTAGLLLRGTPSTECSQPFGSSPRAEPPCSSGFVHADERVNAAVPTVTTCQWRLLSAARAIQPACGSRGVQWQLPYVWQTQDTAFWCMVTVGATASASRPCGSARRCE